MQSKHIVLLAVVLLTLAQRTLAEDFQSQFKPIELFSVQLSSKNLSQS